ncbi:SusC/RagA family TonB-linked outer membrane protein [Dysgonomonas sp. 521]|uniref:SusC/RagA family TonB-linked outer membrane protein n=1 Tax=Dysgonomonas sp. 521 TaxID=2302932 RepID=UPI0013D51D13|nr:SusC/RagA family TonB-linked outer membrane protein [Dysgonomonas sp. 521]NDV96806.1 SusC/RagA family TonB-linked outer membrane protein [Dysgonomonas sp. 521]
MKIKQLYLTLLLLCVCAFSYAQNIEVTGIVKSATDNETLPGVSVTVKNTTNGTMTGVDGEYTLNVPKDAILTFSYVGFKPQEIPVEGRTTIDVSLQEDSHMLDEIVTVGYRTERKADLTGAVSVVDVKDMMSTPDNNAMKALQGRVAGMQISGDGNPAGKVTIRIRGMGTLNNNDPLYIIDGVPSTAGMHELNSNDVESIQVLRDASAASIYGSRAANGVIIVTTKKGKKGSVKVNFDAYVSAAAYNNKIDVLNSKEYAQAWWQAAVNSGQDPNANGLGIVYKDAVGSQGNRVLENIYFPEYLDASKTLRTANTDWFDEVTRTGFAQSYNLSVSNGTEKGNYFPDFDNAPPKNALTSRESHG